MSKVTLIPVADTESKKADMLDCLDKLRARVLSGEIIGFGAAGIDKDDSTWFFHDALQGVRYLRLIGAVSRLNYAINRDCDE